MYRHGTLMDMDFAFCGTLVRTGLPRIRFLFVESRLRTTPREMRPCALLALHLHQVVQGTFTPELMNMLGIHHSRRLRRRRRLFNEPRRVGPADQAGGGVPWGRGRCECCTFE